jgi:predicted RNA-binding Zn-ribbon protein involved in translation (DUF1610 family)
MDSKTLYSSIAVSAAILILGGIAITVLKSTVANVIYVICLIAAVIGIYLLHRRTSHYVCPNCDHVFVIGLYNDLVSRTTGDKKLLKCPKCKKTGYAKEMPYSNEKSSVDH